MSKKFIAVVVIGLLASAAYAGVKDFWRNSVTNSYGAMCDNGTLRSITVEDDGTICTLDGNNKAKCSRDWTPMDAANWACR